MQQLVRTVCKQNIVGAKQLQNRCSVVREQVQCNYSANTNQLQIQEKRSGY